MNPRSVIQFLLAASCSLGFAIAPAATAAAKDADWKAGTGRRVITPPDPIPMSGYASRKDPLQDIGHDLWVKALALEDAEGNRAVVITLDLVGMHEPWVSEACRQITEATGIPRESILLNCSHTHAGPIGYVPDWVEGEPRAALERYLAGLDELVAGAAIDAVTNLAPATLSAGRGFAPFVMNRREFTPNGVILGVQFNGIVDRTLPVMVARDAEDKPLAVLFQVACHNTTLGPKNLTISGDYAGFAQAWVEEKYPGTQAMFMQGCGGDANPYPRGEMDHAREHGETAGREVCRLLEEELAAIAGPLATAYATIDLPLQSVSADEAREMVLSKASYRRGTGGDLLKIYEKGETPPDKLTGVPVTVWQFGQDLTLVALPSEVVVDYVKLIERAIGPLDLWVAAYSNAYFGYIPSARVLEEGGYETRGLFGDDPPGLFAPETESIIVQKVTDLAKQAGRKLEPTP